MNIKYICRCCGKTREITSFWKWLITPHLGSRKFLRCRLCGKLQAMKRKDWKGPCWLDWPKDFK